MEVSSFQGASEKKAYLCEVGTWSSVLSREVSLLQGCLLFNTRRYTLVQGFCFFKLFFVGPTELNSPYKFPFAYGETMTMMTPYGVIGLVRVNSLGPIADVSAMVSP